MTSVTPAFARILACTLASILASAAHAGAVYTAVERDAGGGKELSTTTLSVQNKQLRIEQVEAGKTEAPHVVIYKDGGLLMLDNARKTYTLLDKAAMQKLGGAASQAMKQMEQAMAGMSEEQKAMMQKMMGGKMPGANKPKAPPVEFRNTGRTEKAGEYTCRVWEGVVEGAVRWQHCVVDFDRIAGSRETLQALQAMKTTMQEFIDSMSVGWLQDFATSGWEGVGAIDGYPVLTRTFRDGKPDTETTLKSASEVAVDASAFEPPAGYKRKDMNLP